ncbi:hypothetical protein [Maridesulfovibrio sp.]|uniref:hypothetical protein n=1 Tax=Maridesulfovibrio sp. TaxID=2795000 RepID=UPI003BAB9122
MKRLLILLLFLFLAACTTLADQMQTSLHSHDFNTALAMLEEKGVGISVSPDADEEDLLARKVYENAVYKYYKKRIDDQLDLGNLRRAYDLSVEANSHCPWSEGILKTESGLKSKVAILDSLQKKWELKAQGTKLDPTTAESAFKDLIGSYQILNDTPLLANLLDRSTVTLLHQWAVELKASNQRLTESKINEFATALDDFPNIDENKIALILALNNLATINKINKKRSNKYSKLDDSAQKALNDLAVFFGNGQDFTLLKECYESTKSVFVAWTDSHLAKLLENANVSFSLINSSEIILESVPFIEQKKISYPLAKAHLTRAEAIAGKSKAAAIALLHVQRISELSPTLYAKYGKAIARKAEASIKSSRPVQSAINIGATTSTSLNASDLVEQLFKSGVNIQTKDYFQWAWKTGQATNCSTDVYFSDITKYIPATCELNIINSSFLSHYQDVPNPEKQRLGSKLQNADQDVRNAKWNYDSAVSSHNISPSDYSLSNVNWAYDQYSSALNNYNNILRQYNLEPMTIQEPVYMDYQFEQGTVKSGWAVITKIKSGERLETLCNEEVQTDFVRQGSNINDVNFKYRGDDPINLDSSGKAMRNRLETVIRSTVNNFISTVVPVEIKFSKVGKEEQIILNGIYQPFGPMMENISETWIHTAFQKSHLQAKLENSVR